MHIGGEKRRSQHVHVGLYVVKIKRFSANGVLPLIIPLTLQWNTMPATWNPASACRTSPVMEAP